MVSQIAIRPPHATRLGPFDSASNALLNGPRRVVCRGRMAICETIDRGCHDWYVCFCGCGPGCELWVLVTRYARKLLTQRRVTGLRFTFRKMTCKMEQHFDIWQVKSEISKCVFQWSVYLWVGDIRLTKYADMHYLQYDGGLGTSDLIFWLL